MEEKISEAIKNAIEGAPERKFVESLDIAFTIKDVDLKNPNNRIQEEIRLPNGRGKDVKVAMFAASDAAQKAKAAGIHVIDPSEIEELRKEQGNSEEVGKFLRFLPFRGPSHGSYRSLPRCSSWSTWKDATTSPSGCRPFSNRKWIAINYGH